MPPNVSAPTPSDKGIPQNDQGLKQSRDDPTSKILFYSLFYDICAERELFHKCTRPSALGAPTANTGRNPPRGAKSGANQDISPQNHPSVK